MNGTGMPFDGKTLEDSVLLFSCEGWDHSYKYNYLVLYQL